MKRASSKRVSRGSSHEGRIQRMRSLGNRIDSILEDMGQILYGGEWSDSDRIELVALYEELKTSCGAANVSGELLKLDQDEYISPRTPLSEIDVVVASPRIHRRSLY